MKRFAKFGFYFLVMVASLMLDARLILATDLDPALEASYDASMAQVNQIRDLNQLVRSRATAFLQVAPSEARRCLDLAEEIDSCSNQLESTLTRIKEQNMTPALEAERDAEVSHFQQLQRELENAAAILSAKISHQ